MYGFFSVVLSFDRDSGVGPTRSPLLSPAAREEVQACAVSA